MKIIRPEYTSPKVEKPKISDVSKQLELIDDNTYKEEVE